MNRGGGADFWNLKHRNAISCILSIQICSKIYAKYTCIWNKIRKKRTKSKKILTIIHHYLLEEDSTGQRSCVWGHTPPENFWNLKPRNAISCILSIQICCKIYGNYTCIWNKRRKKLKLKNILTVIYHYLLEGDSKGRRPRMWGHTTQKVFEIWNPEMPFPAFWASKFALKFMLTILVFEIKEGKNSQKNKKLLTGIYHYLVVEKCNNLNRFC
jgi:hypothetical protein